MRLPYDDLDGEQRIASWAIAGDPVDTLPHYPLRL